MDTNYKEESRKARLKVLDLIFLAQTSHVGSNLSCIDILTVLFDKIDLDKDKFVLSKGWAAASLYYFLWKNGRINEQELDSYCQEGSKFIGLVEPVHRDVPFAGGSMSMGLAAGVGFAWAKKLNSEEGVIHILESDGGMQGGMTWEALWFAGHHQLNNIVLWIDKNAFQALGPTEEILDCNGIEDKLESFGWTTKVVDGHDYEQLERAVNSSKNFGQPLAYVCITTKGKGIDFMEDQNIWHYAQLKEDDYLKALECLK